MIKWLSVLDEQDNRKESQKGWGYYLVMICQSCSYKSKFTSAFGATVFKSQFIRHKCAIICINVDCSLSHGFI